MMSVREARARFSDGMAKVAYGAERVIIQRRGRPLINMDDLRKLEALESEAETRKVARAQALAAAAAVREQILTERDGAPLPDSADVIARLRDERRRMTENLRPSSIPSSTVNRPSSNMLTYIDLEHSSALTDPRARAEHQQDRRYEQALFAELSGHPCELLVLEHEADRLDRIRGDVVLLSGLSSDFAAHAPETLARMEAFIRRWEGPLIGFCGGHQLIAHAFGAAIGPLGPLAPGEADPDPSFGPGMRKETGMMAVTLLADDPLFAGLPNPAVFYQEHYWEVKHLPDDFICLASSPACAIQAMRHRHRPIYGTQFHPERSDPAHPHGWRLLRNFFEWVGTLKR